MTRTRRWAGARAQLAVRRGSSRIVAGISLSGRANQGRRCRRGSSLAAIAHAAGWPATSPCRLRHDDRGRLFELHRADAPGQALAEVELGRGRARSSARITSPPSGTSDEGEIRRTSKAEGRRPRGGIGDGPALRGRSRKPAGGLPASRGHRARLAAAACRVRAAGRAPSRVGVCGFFLRGGGSGSVMRPSPSRIAAAEHRPAVVVDHAEAGDERPARAPSPASRGPARSPGAAPRRGRDMPPAAPACPTESWPPEVLCGTVPFAAEGIAAHGKAGPSPLGAEPQVLELHHSRSRDSRRRSRRGRGSSGPTPAMS